MPVSSLPPWKLRAGWAPQLTRSVALCLCGHLERLPERREGQPCRWPAPPGWGQRNVREGTCRTPGRGVRRDSIVLLLAEKDFALVGRSHRGQRRCRGGGEGEWVSGQILVTRGRLDFAGWGEDVLHLQRFFSSLCETRYTLFLVVCGLMKMFKCWRPF